MAEEAAAPDEKRGKWSPSREGFPAEVLSQIEFLKRDIREAEFCRGAPARAALVFHQAARGSVPRSMSDQGTAIGLNVAVTAIAFSAEGKAGVKR